ncbi:MAG: hypothetical protein GC156_09980 [Actinomycetales bacterium]|nr:hypothetical protein [Actinomycetales bacterium]
MTIDDARVLQRAAWAGVASVVTLAVGLALCSLAGVDAPGDLDADIADRISDDGHQIAAGVGLPVIAMGVALLVWFATGLQWLLGRLSGNDPLTHAIVPAAALFGGLLITGTSLDVSSAITGLASDAFTPTLDTARVLGTAGLIIGLTGLTGGAVMVAVTARIARAARALPTWATWASYLVAALCLTSFWNGGAASVAFGIWIVGAVVVMRRHALDGHPSS